MATLTTAVFANPTGPQVRGGSATITTAGTVMTVASPHGAMIDWQGFSVAAGETVRFVQPEGSTVINRVTHGTPGFAGNVQTSGRVLFLSGGTLSGGGVSGDLGVMTAALPRNSALAPPTGVQARDLAARAAQALKQGQAFVIGPRGATLTTDRNSNILLAAGRGAELGDKRLPFVRVLVIAPADTSLDLDALVAARPNGIFNALFLPPVPASSTQQRGEPATALAGLGGTRDALAPQLHSPRLNLSALNLSPLNLPRHLPPQVAAMGPVLVELRVAMLARLPEERMLMAELAPVEERAGAPVPRAPAPVEERVALALLRPAVPVEERVVAVLRETAERSTPVALTTIAVAVPAMLPVAAQMPPEPPVKLAAIQRRMPRILIDYRGAVFHM